MLQELIEKYKNGFTLLDVIPLVEKQLQEGRVELIKSSNEDGIKILKQMESVIIISLQTLKSELELRFSSYNDLMVLQQNYITQQFSIVDNQSIIDFETKKELMKKPIELTFFNKMNQKDPILIFFRYFEQLITIINNLAVLYAKEGLIKKSSFYVSKGILSRQIEINSNYCLFQQAVLFANFSYILMKSNLHESSEYLNRCLRILEVIDPYSQEFQEDQFSDYSSMKCLIQCCYNQDERFLSEPNSIRQDHYIQLQALCFHFYGNINLRLNKLEEQQFCYSQFQILEKQFYYVNPRGYKRKILRDHQERKSGQSERIKTQQSQSKVQNSDFSQVTGELLFSKYIQIGIHRFKIRIVKCEEGIEVIAYQKNFEFQTKIFLSTTELIEYFRANFKKEVKHMYELDEFFKLLISNLQVVDNELSIKNKLI